MGVREYVRRVTDGGDRSHVECRACGKNLEADDEECPDCGGVVVVYEF